MMFPALLAIILAATLTASDYTHVGGLDAAETALICFEIYVCGVISR